MKKFTLIGLIFLIGIGIGMIFSPTSQADVEILNDEYLFPSLISEINNAEESVHLIVFQMINYDDYPDSQSNLLIRALVRAQERGVDVKIITDGALFDNKDNYEYLKELGLNVKSDAEDKVTHNKLIIIDSKKVFVGSSNWSYHSLAENHESNILVTDSKVAREFEDYFEEVWDDY